MTPESTRRDAGAVPLGRIAGIPVSAHWTVLGIVVLIAVVVARGELPAIAPGHGTVAYAVGGLAVALLLMVSLLAHEAAHALVARAHGLGVDGITLWLLGGTTLLRGEPDRPAADLRIAVVGPLTSGVLAALFALAAVGAQPLGGDLAAAVLVELAVVNLVLAVFNLLPAAPLDGGRVLRAIVWAVRGDRWGAGIAAARAGRGLGALLAGLGVAAALAVDPSGLWLALVGWFIATAAREEERRARQGRALEGLPVAAAATAPPALLPADAAAGEVAIALTTPAGRTAGVLLTDAEGGLAGYVPPRPAPVARRPVVPASRLTGVGPDDPLAPLLGRLAEPGSRLVVLTGGTPVGLVSAEDVARLATGSDGRETPTAPAADAGDPPPAGWWWPGGPASGRSAPPPADRPAAPSP